MNRIAIAPHELTTSASATGIKNKHEWLTRARRIAEPQTDLPFATFAPIHYEERYAYPLLGLAYVLVYVGATLWPRLAEPASVLRTGGTLLILAGVMLVTVAERRR